MSVYLSYWVTAKMSEISITSNNSNQTFVYLIEILTKEVTLYERMVDVLQKKQDAIIIGGLEKLRNYLQEEQSLTQDALSLAGLRKDCVTNLNQIYKLTKSDLKLSTIIDIAPPKHSINLMNLKCRIKGSLDLITKVNRENSYLLNFSIEHIKGLAHLFLRADEESSRTYDIDGILASPEEGCKMLNFQI